VVDRVNTGRSGQKCDEVGFHIGLRFNLKFKKRMVESVGRVETDTASKRLMCLLFIVSSSRCTMGLRIIEMLRCCCRRYKCCDIKGNSGW